MIKLPETFGIVEVTATTIVALMTGIFIGRQFSVSKAWGSNACDSFINVCLKQVQKQQYEDDLDDLDEIPEGSFDADKYDDYKMVLVVRTDLGMTKGKMAAQVRAYLPGMPPSQRTFLIFLMIQCGHATLACYKALLKSNPAVTNAFSYLLLTGDTHSCAMGLGIEKVGTIWSSKGCAQGCQ